MKNEEMKTNDMKPKRIANKRWKVLIGAFLIGHSPFLTSHSSFLICGAQAQTYETRFERSVTDLMNDVS